MVDMPLGVYRLDSLLDGGVPTGSVIVLATEPGAGGRKFAHTSAAMNALATADNELYERYYLRDLDADSVVAPGTVNYVSLSATADSLEATLGETVADDAAASAAAAITYRDFSPTYFADSHVPEAWYRGDETPSLPGDVAEDAGTGNAGAGDAGAGDAGVDAAADDATSATAIEQVTEFDGVHPPGDTDDAAGAAETDTAETEAAGGDPFEYGDNDATPAERAGLPGEDTEPTGADAENPETADSATAAGAGADESDVTTGDTDARDDESGDDAADARDDESGDDAADASDDDASDDDASDDESGDDAADARDDGAGGYDPTTDGGTPREGDPGGGDGGASGGAQSIVPALQAFLTDNAPGSFTVIDAVTDLRPLPDEEAAWPEVTRLLRGLTQAVSSWGGVVLVVADREAVTDTELGALSAGATGTLEFAWETGGSQRARVMNIRELRGALDRLDRDDIVQFEAEMHPRGYDLSNVRKIR